MLPYRTVLAIFMAATVATMAAPAAQAHETPNHGTIKVHDEASADPATRNEPHICAPFWIEGFAMTDGNGWLVFESIPPTTNPPVVVLVVNWTADGGSEAEGYHFNEGPIALPDGHYRVEAFVGDPEPHAETHSSKSKVFWVDCADTECPGPRNVTALANDNETISVSWDYEVDAESYNVMRAIGAGSFSPLASVDGDTTTYLDTNVTTGVTYRYQVTVVVNDGEESEVCGTAEATAIPDLPGVFAIALAAVGGVAAYAIRRSRKP